MATFPYFSRNGKLLPMSEAVIPLANIEFCYGFGVYEHIAVRDGIPFFAAEHIERLFQSARTIGLDHPFSHEDVSAAVHELTAQCPTRCNLKILLIGAKDAERAELDILPSNPLFIEKKAYAAGVSVMSQTYERYLPDAKTLNMLPSYLAHRASHECGCYDTVFTDAGGNILEGTKTNVFAVRGKELFTAPDDRVLCGITRSIVCRLAVKEGFSVRLECIPAAEIDRYDGLFLTSTSAKILPIRTFDAFSYEKIAPSIGELLSSYERFLGECEGVTTTL